MAGKTATGGSSATMGRGGASTPRAGPGSHAGAPCTGTGSRTGRRWLIPTSLRPCNITSPRPMPAKQSNSTGPTLIARVDRRVGDAQLGQGGRDSPADPPHRGDDVAPDRRKARIARRHDHVEPAHRARLDEHRSPSAAPPHDVDTGGGRRAVDDSTRWLEPSTTAGPSPAQTAHEARPRGEQIGVWNSPASRGTSRVGPNGHVPGAARHHPR